MRNCDVVISGNRSDDPKFNRSHAPAARKLIIGTILTLLSMALPHAALSQDDIQDQGGPIMQAPITVYLIFWLPSGFVYDTGANLTPAGIGNYETRIARFFSDVSESSYFKILTQYQSTCGLNGLNQTCLAPGNVSVGGTFVDTRPYCHGTSTTCTTQAGTKADPLLDADIQQEVKNFVSANGLTPGLNNEFFVFTGANVQACLSSSMCTWNSFCAYHFAFGSFIYAFMPNVNSINGCSEGVSTSPNGQVSTDREIVAVTHEFFESVSDPLITAWVNAGSTEIGDNCNQKTGSTQPDGRNVTLNGNPYVVQQIWSNDDGGCVLTFASAIFGPSIEYKTLTGGDNLRGDSSASSNLESAAGSAFQTVTLKTQTQPEWANNSTHVRVFQLSQTQPADVSVTLTSHPSGLEAPDNWNIQSLDLKLRNPNGSLICEQTMSGNPLARLTGSAPTQTFPTPKCAPPPPPVFVKQVQIKIATGNDNARSDTELWATLPGEPAFCLKPSNNAEPDGVCPNGGSATDQNGKQSWDNWTTSTQSFPLLIPQTLSTLGTITILLLEHNSGFETDDNWDIQGITVTMTDSTATTTTVLNMSNPQGSNCMARLKGAPNPSSVTYILSSTNPMGSNLSNSTFGPTPPGSCPQ